MEEMLKTRLCFYTLTDCFASEKIMQFSLFLSEVRAPIPQKQDILVEPEPLFGGIIKHLF